ncbi:hypothetical protein CspHIS471_0610770 [Cutaneotrichosporon sp. HIS471]|nr:hypothetical protein CspHIS471_0610770 [Cutaneotrichosporon sp. HIS471]
MSAQEYYQQPSGAPPPPAPQNAYQPNQYAFNAPTGGQGGDYAMKQSQPYSNSYPPPAGPPAGQPTASPAGMQYPDPEYGGAGGNKFGDTAPFSQATEKTGARFRPKSRIRDPIFLVLFIAAIGGWVALSVISLRTFVSLNGLGGGLGNQVQGGTGTGITLDRHTAYLLLTVCGLALVIAAAWLGLVRMFTKIIMEITLALTVLLNIGICIYYFIIKYWSGAIIFLVIALISVICYWSMRKRIPLAKLLLQTTIDITKHHPSVYFVVLLGLLVQAALSVWFSFTAIAIYVKWTPGSDACTATSCSSGKVAGLIFYAIFVFYWASQVVSNVILCTLAGGVFGGWYYYGPRMNDGSGLPKNATGKAFARASTMSLGSIAFGSLIVTILEILQTLFQALQNYQAQQGDTIGMILACCATCCISFIRWIVEWFNKYAYIEIALYGKPYIQAAKDTWRLMKDRGIDALVNDSLVGTVILWGSYINGFLCGLYGFLYLKFTEPSYNREGQYTAPVVLFAFAIGINLSFTIGSVLDAGVSTIFVGLGEDPMVLGQRAPVLFELIRQTYPRIVQGIPNGRNNDMYY